MLKQYFIGLILPFSILISGAALANDILNQPEEESLTQALGRTYSVISDPNIANELKSRQVTDLFRQIDLSCQANCEIPLRILSRFNETVGSPTAREIRDAIKSSPINENSKLPIETIIDLSARLGEVLNGMDREKLEHRISASIELIRYLVTLKETTLFALASNPQSLPQTKEEITQDISLLRNQLKALAGIFNVLKQKKETLGSILIEAKKDDKERSNEKVEELSRKLQFSEKEAEEISRHIRDLGLFYSKFIQSISNNSLILGDGASRYFKQFQDSLEAIPGEEVLRIIKEETGREANEIFVEFDASKPIASATVGQAYDAKIRDSLGRIKEVIVKVQRPNLEPELDRNRKLNTALLKTSHIFFGSEKTAPILDLIASQVVGLEEAIQEELNFESEMRHLQRARNLLRFVPGITVPKPVQRLTSRRLLVMEKIPGQNIDTMIEAESSPLTSEKRKRLFSLVWDAFLFQTFVIGEVHGDMHPGNVLASENGDRLGLIDWSHVFRARGIIGQPLRAFYYLYSGNSTKFASVFAKMGTNRDFDLDGFSKEVQVIMDAKNIKKNSLTEILTGKSEVNSENALSAMGEIIKVAQTKFLFAATPRYFQFFRTVMPLTSTLIALGRDIPKAEKNKIMKWKLILLAPKGALQYIGGHALEVAHRPMRALSRGVIQLMNRKNQSSLDLQCKKIL